MSKTTPGHTAQPLLFDVLQNVNGSEPANGLVDQSSTFLNNLALPVHRWFRYSAGFSAKWARQLILQEKHNGRKRVLDPFAGSGTAILEAELNQVRAIGLESHPFVCRIAKAKLQWREDPNRFADYALSILDRATKASNTDRKYPSLLQQCYPVETLLALDSLRNAWGHTADGSPYSELAWLALVSIIRECSPVGTAQWQYVLPKKVKLRALNPYDAYKTKVGIITSDMVWRQTQPRGYKARIARSDARDCASVPDDWADLVITSPPYANNYDYADATRLEMTFMGEIQGWGCLQESVRKHLIRSCTQHVTPLIKDTDAIVSDPLLTPISTELRNVCAVLAEERERHGGKKPYNTMVAAYFRDMASVWLALRRVSKAGCLACFVIGDSAPYGVYVPVDRWLGELAVAAGFKSFTFEKIRDRNVKWKNRKHRVPLHEGRLWVRG